MDDRKVVLIKLSQGLIGEENAHFLGTLLVSKLYQTALSRQESANRPYFWMYLDEFHNFVTPSMENILSGARKYNIGLTLAHQEFRQLQSRSQEVAESVLSNCYTRICFRLGDADAEKFARGLSFFDSSALRNLGIGEAIARIERSEYDFNLKTDLPGRIDSTCAAARKQAIREYSRKAYAGSLTEVRSSVDVRSEKTIVRSSPKDTSPVPDPQISIKQQAGPRPPASEAALKISHGGGGKHHQELQAVIKRMAETYGFVVELEKNVSDGAGRIDVALKKGELRIACEVSVTSSVDYETKNIHKCLAEGYEYVVVVAANRKKLSILKRKVLVDLPLHHQGKVKVLGLVDLLTFLRDFNASEKIKDNKAKPAGQRLDFTEACEFFSIGTSTLYRWIREGRVPFYRVGREYRFDRSELILMGRHDLTGKTKASVKLEPLEIEKSSTKPKKEQNSRYRKMLKLD